MSAAVAPRSVTIAAVRVQRPGNDALRHGRGYELVAATGFDIEHAFKLLKGTLGLTAAKVRPSSPPPPPRRSRHAAHSESTDDQGKGKN